MHDSGYHWGIYPGNKIYTIPYGWDGDRKPSGTDVDPWKIAGTTTNADYTATLGDLRFQENDEYVSPVMNRGNGNSYKITIEKNQTCGDGYGIAVQYRGSASPFNIDASSPAWEDYPVGGVYITYQYVQIKLKQTTFLEVG